MIVYSSHAGDSDALKGHLLCALHRGSVGFV